MQDLTIIQKVYDLIQWYVPILNRLPRNYKYQLGDRVSQNLCDILEALIAAKYAQDKLAQLQGINVKLEILRHQIRMLRDFGKMSIDRYEYVSKKTNEIGTELGGWIKQQKGGKRKNETVQQSLF